MVIDVLRRQYTCTGWHGLPFKDEVQVGNCEMSLRGEQGN